MLYSHQQTCEDQFTCSKRGEALCSLTKDIMLKYDFVN